MDFKTYAFISYQTSDKVIAGSLKNVLSTVRIDSFLAHEDIHVSEEWRLKILEEISKADLFIPLLSKNYHESPWCVQESGIAAFRNDITVIPLSIDGTIPQGFISQIQSTKIDPERIDIEDLVPGFIKYDFSKGIEIINEIIGSSSSYRNAEANFQLILPYLSKMKDDQIITLLEKSAENSQVHDAGLCAVEYIPPLLDSHGHLLDPIIYDFLKKNCERYA